MFGSFSKEDVHDLFKNTTSDLHFVWQDRAAPNRRCASFGNNLVVQTTAFANKGGLSQGVLSPNIPPNPPTSPVDGNYDTSNRGGLASKLNVNAIPFVPATLSVIVPETKDSLGVTKNSATQQLTFLSSATTNTVTEGRHRLPGVVVQTIGEPSSTTRLESRSRDIESDSHSSERSTNSTAEQVAQTSEKHSNDCEHSKPPPSTLHLDLSTVQQSVDPPQRTQPCSSSSSDSTHTGSRSCSVSSDTGRQIDVVAQTKPHPPPSSGMSMSESRSESHSPTPTPPPSHMPTSPSHTAVPSQDTNSPSLGSFTAQVKNEVPSSQGTLQQPPVHVTQSSSQSASPGSVSSLSTASATSAVPSSASSSTSGSGGVKLKSWASIVGKKSSEPVGQASQTSLATSPHVQTVPSSNIATKRGDDEISSHDLTVVMATDSQEGGDETQKQFPPLNPVQLANLGSTSK